MGYLVRGCGKRGFLRDVSSTGISKGLSGRNAAALVGSSWRRRIHRVLHGFTKSTESPQTQSLGFESPSLQTNSNLKEFFTLKWAKHQLMKTNTTAQANSGTELLSLLPRSPKPNSFNINSPAHILKINLDQQHSQQLEKGINKALDAFRKQLSISIMIFLH